MGTVTADTVLKERGDAAQVLVETTPTGRAPSPFYLPQLDVLRFFAFLSVFVCHAFPHDVDSFLQMGAPAVIAKLLVGIVMSGTFGVDLFFVLSSYLITTLLLREIDFRGKVDLGRFYLRRTLRIWPLYFLFLAVCFFLQQYITSAHVKGAQLLPFFYFLGNYAIIRNPRIFSFILHLWSISVEEQFYLVWALFLRWVKASWFPLLAILAILFTMGTRLTMLYRHGSVVFFWVSTLTRLDSLAMGVLLACGAIFAKEIRWRWFWVTGATVVLVADEMVLPVAHRTVVSVTVGYLVVALACTVIVKSALGIRLSDGRLARAVVYLGKISYGLYVWHWLIIQLMNRWLPGTQLSRNIVRISASMAVSILVAAVSYEFYEKWFVSIKNRFTYVISRPV